MNRKSITGNMTSRGHTLINALHATECSRNHQVHHQQTYWTMNYETRGGGERILRLDKLHTRIYGNIKKLWNGSR